MSPISTEHLKKDTNISPVDERTQLLDRLRGQYIRIPDIRSLFSDYTGIYTPKINPHKLALDEAVNAKLGRVYSKDTSKLEKLKAADFSFFTAVWWPDTPLEKLRILAFMVIWLFTWDDEIDEPSGTCANDMLAATANREETEIFVEYCLGLSKSDADPVQPRNYIVESFREIGEAFRNAYNLSQLQRFHEEIKRFMIMSRHEQEIKLKHRVPTLKEYWNFRMGTSAVFIGLAAGEYSVGSQIPDVIMSSAAMQVLWKETNVIISITNDLLSLRKEIKQGCIDSLVPLNCASGKSVQRSVADAMLALAQSRYCLDEAAEALTSQDLGTDPSQRYIEQFIEVCRSNCVGNLIWSLHTDRYRMNSVLDENGCRSFEL